MSISIIVDRDGNIQVQQGATKETHFLAIASLGRSCFSSVLLNGDTAEVAQLKAQITELEQLLEDR